MAQCHKQTDVQLTSRGVSEYSLTLSTATMLVSSSLVIRTITFSVPVICQHAVIQDLWNRFKCDINHIH